MKERPILFSGEMVKAILDDRKTQTRRVVKPDLWDLLDQIKKYNGKPAWQCLDFDVKCPWEGVDRLWVKETFNYGFAIYKDDPEDDRVIYRSDVPDIESETIKWKPSIFMKREDSRITLGITDIRVERLNEISEVDAKAEGAENRSDLAWEYAVGNPDPYEAAVMMGHRIAFRDLWNSINEKRGYGWKSNPWVWVIEFKRIENGR